MDEIKENILFFREDVEYPLPEKRLRKWLFDIAKTEGSEIIGINYIFCSDDYLLKINREHLNHDYYTDIITFPYQQGENIESDIFISIDRVAENAAQFGYSKEQELLRVMAHGLLHLIGYNDKSEEEEEKMREKEEECLALWVVP